MAALAVAWFVPSDSYLILPDGAKPLADKVTVEGAKPDDDAGGIYFVDVILRKSSLLEKLVSPLRPDGSELVPAEAIVPPARTSRSDATRTCARWIARRRSPRPSPCAS